jgi:universal stress protein E
MLADASSSFPAMVVDVTPEMLALESERKMRELRALVSDYRVPESNVHLQIGGVGEQLCRLAEKLNADVLAMGAISRSAFQRALVGSTAEAVLERLECDVLVVKSPNFAELLPI